MALAIGRPIGRQAGASEGTASLMDGRSLVSPSARFGGRPTSDAVGILRSPVPRKAASRTFHDETNKVSPPHGATGAQARPTPIVGLGSALGCHNRSFADGIFAHRAFSDGILADRRCGDDWLGMRKVRSNC